MCLGILLPSVRFQWLSLMLHYIGGYMAIGPWGQVSSSSSFAPDSGGQIRLSQLQHWILKVVLVMGQPYPASLVLWAILNLQLLDFHCA